MVSGRASIALPHMMISSRSSQYMISGGSVVTLVCWRFSHWSLVRFPISGKSTLTLFLLMSSRRRLVRVHTAGGMKGRLHSEMFRYSRLTRVAMSLGRPLKSAGWEHFRPFLLMSSFIRVCMRRMSGGTARRLLPDRSRTPTFRSVRGSNKRY